MINYLSPGGFSWGRHFNVTPAIRPTIHGRPQRILSGWLHLYCVRWLFVFWRRRRLQCGVLTSLRDDAGRERRLRGARGNETCCLINDRRHCLGQGWVSLGASSPLRRLSINDVKLYRVDESEVSRAGALLRVAQYNLAWSLASETRCYNWHSVTIVLIWHKRRAKWKHLYWFDFFHLQSYNHYRSSHHLHA